MKISTKGRYGLRILIDIAVNEGAVPRLVRDICKSQNISEKYASRLILPLRDNGIISTVRGARGGLKMKKKPEDITLLDVIKAMEGDISIVDCVSCPKSCKRSNNCSARNVWKNLNDTIRTTLAATTLKDMIDMQGNCPPNEYCI